MDIKQQLQERANATAGDQLLLDARSRIEQLEEWERLFQAWCVRALPVPDKEPLWPNSKWSQDVAMVAHALDHAGRKP